MRFKHLPRFGDKEGEEEFLIRNQVDKTEDGKFIVSDREAPKLLLIEILGELREINKKLKEIIVIDRKA